MALIRYPGSKHKLATEIWSLFPDAMRFELWMLNDRMEYREPFFGAGAIGFRVLERLDSRYDVWLNDKDVGMVSLWKSVLECPRELAAKVAEFSPSTERFYQFKEEDGRSDLGHCEQGFRKLALHRMSYSGLGAMSGGPLGGASQGGKYNVDCRWVPEKIRNDIFALHGLMSRFDRLKITCGDFGELIEGATDKSFIYLDPPYYEKGPALYKHSMDDEMHDRLAAALRTTKAQWVLSYDDHPRVRELYSWAEFREMAITYTTAKSTDKRRPKNQEVVILPRW